MKKAANRALLLGVFVGFHCGAVSAQTPVYVGSEQCADCHQSETDAWATSHHALAWTPPTAAHILGDFDNATYSHNGVTTHFFKRGPEFFIETDGPEGGQTIYPIKGVAGIEPLQQYLIETAPGKVQSHDVVWDVVEEQWYHLYPDQELPAGDGLHWTGPYKNWNARCAECHATGFVKGYDPTIKTYQSSQAEIGVGCEACHGPSQAHIEWATTQTAFDPSVWSGLGVTGLTIDFSGDAEREIQQCAGCHARREAFGEGNPLPGTPFHDAYRLSTLREGLYHPDGQILEEVYVYGSFLQSKMYEKGVSCSNCHDVHSADMLAEGNGLCTQCHSAVGNQEFPSLKLANYDDTAHHFHTVGSDGAQCKSCHMPERVYMGTDWRRDHGFRVPRPDLSLRTSAPNACTDCHADQTDAWAAEELNVRFPDSAYRGSHFSEVFARARISLSAEVQSLIDIADYDALPAIVRASALELAAQTVSRLVGQAAIAHLNDPDPLVRTAAILATRGLEPADRAIRLSPLLSDATKAVRIAAARETLDLQVEAMSADAKTAVSAARSEWLGSIRNKTDFPETQLIVGGIALTQRDFRSAINAFREATELDPQLVQAWIMQVRILSALQEFASAKTVLDEALRNNPKSIELSLMKADLQ